jgi:hypothetical protein
MTTSSLSRGADPLILMIKEHAKLLARRDEIDERADKIRSSLPENVREGQVSIVFSAGFTDPGNFTFRTELEVNVFARTVHQIAWRDRSVPHWDRIVAQLIDDFRAAKKAQIDDVLEASGVAALDREAAAVADQAYELHTKICDTPASSFPALLYQLELLRDDLEVPDLLDTIIAGVKRLAAAASAEKEAGPEVIGFGEPGERR